MRFLPITLLLACSLMAQQPQRERMMRQQGTPSVAALKDAIGLTDAQVQQLIQARKDRNTAARPLLTQIAEKQRTLRETLNAGGASAGTVGQLQLDIAALRKQLQDLEKQSVGQARALLSASQLTKLKAVEDAAKLMPAVREAAGLNLIEGLGAGPGPMGLRGPAGMMRRSGGPPN